MKQEIDQRHAEQRSITSGSRLAVQGTSLERQADSSPGERTRRQRSR